MNSTWYNIKKVLEEVLTGYVTFPKMHGRCAQLAYLGSISVPGPPVNITPAKANADLTTNFLSLTTKPELL